MKFDFSAPGAEADTLIVEKSDKMSDIKDYLYAPRRNIKTLIWHRRDGLTKNLNLRRTLPSLQKVVLGPGIRTISAKTFIGMRDLKEAVFEEGLTTIKEYAFCNTGLQKVSLPTTISFLGYGVFAGCCDLTEINIPRNAPLPLIPSSFASGTKITTFTCPDVTGELGNSAFMNSAKLRDIILNEGLRVIGLNALSGTAIAELRLPSTLRSILGNDKLPNLRRVSVAPHGELRCADNMLINKDDCLVFCPASCLSPDGELRLPDGVRDVRYGAGDGLSNAKTLVLPDCFPAAKVTTLPHHMAGGVRILVSPSHPEIQIREGVLYSKDGATLLLLPPGVPMKTMTVSPSVKNVASGAIYHADLDALIFMGDIELAEKCVTGSKIKHVIFNGDARMCAPPAVPRKHGGLPPYYHGPFYTSRCDVVEFAQIPTLAASKSWCASACVISTLIAPAHALPDLRELFMPAHSIAA